MNRVFGRVLVKESRLGIPDLVVAVFDADLKQGSDADTPNSWLDPAVDWTSGIGDRLGSAVTKRDGSFELIFDDKAIGPHEQRADLILAVMAPDLARSPEGPPPPPPNKGVLHLAAFPRVNSGRSEGYIVLVLQSQLKQHDLPFPVVNQLGVAPQEALVRSITESETARAAFKNSLADSMRLKTERRQVVARAAASFVQQLSAAPLVARKSATFVRPDNPVVKAQGVARENGVRRLSESPSSATVRLSNSDASVIGRDHGGAADTAIEFPSVTFCGLLGGNGAGASLERMRSLLEAAREQAAAVERLAQAASKAGVSSTGDPLPLGEASTPPEDALSAEEAVRRRVLGQIQSLPMAASSLAGQPDDALERLRNAVRELNSLSEGPSDVVAYHDFHTLQIAFEQVWAEAFDEHLRAAVSDLYARLVDVHEEVGAMPPSPTSIREISGLLEFIASAQETTSSFAVIPIPAAVAASFPDVDLYVWNSLDLQQQTQLLALGEQYQALAASGSSHTESDGIGRSSEALMSSGAFDDLVARKDEIVANPHSSLGRALELIREIQGMLGEPYAFQCFAPGSVNFGLLATYRQEWTPLAYQVGDLVATIPLAPGESRKFTKKEVVRQTRSKKELIKALSSHQEESSQVSRAQAEIVRKASSSTNFTLTAEGSFTIGVASISATSAFALNQAQESATTKSSFHEAVSKAAQEYRNERSVEIDTSGEISSEATTSGELTNPNNELTVTYLLYELERRFGVREQIHRLTPVILVAQEVPAPHMIDEAWLLLHDWILRRVLLDDGLRPALDYVRDALVGDEVAVEVKRGAWETQRSIVKKLQAAVDGLLNTREQLRQTVIDATLSERLASAEESAEGIGTKSLELFGSDDDETATLEARRKAFEARLVYLDQALAEMQARLKGSEDAMAAATAVYTSAIELQAARRTAVDQLRVHVKQNIFYYMQAIWDHEPPDQRFFRLYRQDVETPRAEGTCRLVPVPRTPGMPWLPGMPFGEFRLVCDVPSLTTDTHKLGDIADLDRPLGYKGNYIVFPLKRCTYLTDFMMREYIDTYFGLRDPDAAAEFSTEELLSYAELVWPTLTSDDRAALEGLVLDRLSRAQRDGETIIVPTGQLFMEALLGGKPLLEPFKLLHRGMDVEKARAEVRQAELESLRYAARLVNGEREDPRVEKKVVLQGIASPVVSTES